jgi:hypothetical protein
MNRVGFKDKVVYLKGSAQALTFECPEGRPSADGTVTIYDSRYERTDTSNNPIVTGAATRKAVETAVSSASGASQSNPKRVNCTPPAALAVGDFVLLANAAGQSERVEVAAIAGAYFDAAHDLAFDYTTADTIKSAVLTSPAIPTTFTDEDENLGEDYEALWVYVVVASTYARTTRWDLVREAPETSVFDSDLLERFPDLKLFAFASSPSTFAPFIRSAQRDVDAMLISLNRDPDKLRGNELVKYLVALGALYQAAMNGVHPNGVSESDNFERRKAEWERWSNLLLGGSLKIPYDTDESGVVSDSKRRTTSIQLIR